jgi:hypothetical protein
MIIEDEESQPKLGPAGPQSSALPVTRHAEVHHAHSSTSEHPAIDDNELARREAPPPYDESTPLLPAKHRPRIVRRILYRILIAAILLCLLGGALMYITKLARRGSGEVCMSTFRLLAQLTDFSE